MTRLSRRIWIETSGARNRIHTTIIRLLWGRARGRARSWGYATATTPASSLTLTAAAFELAHLPFIQGRASRDPLLEHGTEQPCRLDKVDAVVVHRRLAVERLRVAQLIAAVV